MASNSKASLVRLFVLLLIPITGISGEEPGLPVSVRELLKQLESSDRSLRRDAEQELMQLGPGALDHLPAPELLPNVSVKQAVRRVRIHLEGEAARASLKASRVTLHGQLTIEQAVAELTQQTGNQVLTGELNDADRQLTFSIDWDDATFWQAIADLERRELSRSAEPESRTLPRHLWARYRHDGDVLVLAPVDLKSGQADDNAAPATGQVAAQSGQLPLRTGPMSHIDEAFRVDVLGTTRRPVGDGSREVLQCSARIVCEPRLRPLFLRYQSRDLALSTRDGRTIPAFNSDSKIEVPLGVGGREVRLAETFLNTSPAGRDPKHESTSVAAPRDAERSTETSAPDLLLRGVVRLLIAAREQPIEFHEAERSSGITRRRGGVTVTVTRAAFDKPAPPRSPTDKPASTTARIQVRVNYDLGTSAFESHQTWVFHNRVYLEDADGRRFPPNGGFTTLFQADGSAGVEYLFEQLPADCEWKFVYVAPTLLIDREIQLSPSVTPPAETK